MADFANNINNEPVQALRKWEVLAYVLNGAVIAFAIWGFASMSSAAIVLAFLMPWVILLLAIFSYKPFSMGGKWNAFQATIFFSLVLSASTLSYRALKGFQILGWDRLLLLSLLPAIVIFFAVFAVNNFLKTGSLSIHDWVKSKSSIMLILLIFFSWLYGLAGIFKVNTSFSRTAAAMFTARVLEKHVTYSYASHGFMVPYYYVTLAPWGPQTKQTTAVASIGFEFIYQSLQPGKQACIALHQGRLGVQWYEITVCNY